MITLLLFSNLPIYANNIPVEFEGSRIENQEKAIKTYEKIIKKIDSDKSLYTDSYAGSYIDVDGNLVMLVKSNAKRVGQLKKLLKEPNIITSEVNYSLNELFQQREIYKEKLQKLSRLDDTTGFGINIESNNVNVYLKDYDNDLSVIQNIYSGDNIKILRTSENSEISLNIINGREITIVSNGSVGFGAVKNGKNGKKGIVIAAHVVGVGINAEVKYQGNMIGKVTDYNLYDGSYSDAAFVELYSGYEPTNDTAQSYNFTDYSTTILQGAVVQFTGKTTNIIKTATIKDAYNSGSASGRAFTDFFLLSEPALPGDSGGPIWYPSSGYKTGKLIGTLKASTSTQATGGKLEHIIWDLQLDSIITN